MFMFNVQVLYFEYYFAYYGTILNSVVFDLHFTYPIKFYQKSLNDNVSGA